MEVDGVHYWDMYFILQLLRVPEERVEVDIQPGTRDYLVISVMRNYKHLFVSEYEGVVNAIASTRQGVKFYEFLRRVGYGSVETEEHGKTIISILESEFYGRQIIKDDSEDEIISEAAYISADEAALLDPHFSSAAWIVTIYNECSYDILNNILSIDLDRYETITYQLVESGILNEKLVPQLTEDQLRSLLKRNNL